MKDIINSFKYAVKNHPKEFFGGMFIVLGIMLLFWFFACVLA